MIRFILLLHFIFGFHNYCLAVVPALEREVTLNLSNERITNVLNKIQEQTGLIFSYQPALVNSLAPVSLQLRQKTVREALSLMFPKNIIFKSKNNYIILKEKPLEINPKKTELSGYVYDKTTDKKIPNVTIYDKKSLESVTTDAYGYYSIKVPVTLSAITINKENYKDTSLALADLKENKLTCINLNPVYDHKETDSILRKTKLKKTGSYPNRVISKFKGYINLINVKDTFNRNFQISFLPFIGTNHKLSGSVYNRISINILGGYSKGTNGVEIGGGFNIDKENVRGTQIAGLYNVVFDSLKGVQIAGFYNYTEKNARGSQIAGLFNSNKGTQTGVQIAGFKNVNSLASNGTSIAGLFNRSKSTHNGVLIAGLLNINKKSVKGTQVAGIGNISRDTLTGFAIAGVFNTTHYLRGLQIAPFNFVDSASGVPVGVLSFVKKGVHQLELSGDEVFYTGLSFRTGVPAFYNIVSAGLQSGSKDLLWQIGYGLGTSFKIKNKLRSDITLSQHHVSKNSFYNTSSELFKLYWGLEYRFNKRCAVAAGPTFNMYLSDVWNFPINRTAADAYTQIAPYTMFNSDLNNGFNLKGWVGFKIAIRFF